MDEERLVDTTRRLAEALEPGDLDATLNRITGAAVALLPDVEYASLLLNHAEGRLQTVAPTAALLNDVDAAQKTFHEGPCYEAVTDSVHVIAPDLVTDERFPSYAPVALAAGIRAQAAVRLFDTPTSQGALNLYSTRAGAFADFETVVALFSHQAAVALAYAGEVDNLNEAVRTRTTIGQAIGIVMERYQLTAERAFAFLTRVSQHRNVKLRLVAQDIIDAGEHRGDQG